MRVRCKKWNEKEEERDINKNYRGGEKEEAEKGGEFERE